MIRSEWPFRLPLPSTGWKPTPISSVQSLLSAFGYDPQKPDVDEGPDVVGESSTYSVADAINFSTPMTISLLTPK